MIPVKQTILGAPDGNCLPACVASILELHIEDVPNFCAGQDDGRWLDRLADWLAERGLCAAHACFVDAESEATPDPDALDRARDFMRRRRIGYAIVNGYTARGLSHSTVWFDGVLVHDPHPEPSPTTNVVSIIVIAHRDPKLVNRGHGGPRPRQTCVALTDEPDDAPGTTLDLLGKILTAFDPDWMGDKDPTEGDLFAVYGSKGGHLGSGVTREEACMAAIIAEIMRVKSAAASTASKVKSIQYALRVLRDAVQP